MYVLIIFSHKFFVQRILHLGILQLRLINYYVVCIVSNLLDIYRNINIFHWVQGLKNILNIIYIYIYICMYIYKQMYYIYVNI